MAEQLVDLRRPAMETFDGSSSCISNRRATTGSFDHTTMTSTTSKSRRTLRQTKSVNIEAYPLPDPSLFENAVANDILYPMQSLKKEREKSNDPPASSDTDKQPFPGGASKREIEEDHVQKEMPARKVVVVYDGEKKFASAPVDIALSGSYARAEGDAIVVVVFLEHIMSPMGMKMVADLKQFGGVNQSILEQTVLGKKTEVETMLRDTARLQLCQRNKIQLDVKVLPGPNPKALVAKEVIDSHATCVIFDKNAMKHRKYYEEHLACQILRLRSDGRSVETVSLFGRGMISANPSMSSSIAVSDSSSDSSMNYDHLTGSAPGSSIWSKLKMFGSKRNSSSHGGSVVGGSSRTSSNLGSPRPPPLQDEPHVISSEVLDESFSFDSPKPNPAAEAYVYAAEKFGTYSRGSNKQPTALAAAKFGTYSRGSNKQPTALAA